MSTGSNAERIRDLEYLVKGLVMQRKAAVTDRFKPDIIHHDVASMEAQITELQRKIGAQLERLADPIGRIEKIDERIAEIRQEIALLSNAKNVEKFEKAMAQVDALRAMGMSDSDLDALRAMLESGEVG